jgi:hypothetical protein
MYVDVISVLNRGVNLDELQETIAINIDKVTQYFVKTISALTCLNQIQLRFLLAPFVILNFMWYVLCSADASFLYLSLVCYILLVLFLPLCDIDMVHKTVK